jgi:hypothetical protein
MAKKSKKFLRERLKVLNNLLESVNSQEEYDMIEKEKREVSLELLE